MLILKQNAANTVPTPPSGKGTIFLDDSDVLSVKTSDGNVETFPTVAASNAQVVFINGTALSGEAAFTYDFNNNVLTVSGNIAAGNIKTDNLLYANGNPWDLQQPGGSNTQIQFNDADSFGGSAAFTFNKTSNVVTMSGNLSVGNVNGGNLVGANYLTGTLTTAAQPNITSVGTLTDLSVSGNALVGGNLTVNGNLVYVNVESLDVEDPIISLGGGPNGAAPTSDDGKDRGTALQYYSGSAKTAFMGWDNSNAEFGMGSAVSINSEIVTWTSYGNLRLNVIFANGAGLTNIPGANITGNISGNISNADYATSAGTAGTVTTAAQPNITSVGTLSALTVSGNLGAGNINGANLIAANYVQGTLTSASQPNITSVGQLTGLTMAANADISLSGSDSSVSGANLVSASYLTGTLTTASQPNITSVGTLSSLAVTGNATAGNVYANSGTVGASLLTGTLTTATQPNITSVGTLGSLSVTGNVTAGGVKTDNLYYANGSAWDLSDPGGSNTQIQFNDDESFGGSAAFTFDKSSNLVSVSANLNANNLNATTHITSGNVWANSGTVGASLLTGTLTTAAQPNITSVGTLSSVAITGNATAGNVYANAGTVGASLLTGTLTTASQPNITAVGTLSSLTVSGNASAGNINGGNLVTANYFAGTLTTAAQPNITSVGTLSSLDVTGNATAGNVYANSGTIGASLLTGTLTTAAQPNVTSVGTLTSLAVTGNGVFGNVYANSGTIGASILKGEGGNISNVTAGNITGQVANALVAGTVYTAAQPNITSVGTLTSLAVTGNASAGNISTGGVLSVTGNANVGNLGTAQVLASANVTAPQFISNVSTGTAPLVVSSTTKVANLNADLLDGYSTATAATANTVVIRDADGSFSANIITGTLSGAATTAGTVTTAAQPNITSVGTLTSLAVTGNASAGNISTGGVLSVTGNANVGNIGANNAVFTLVTGTLTTAAQPNVTSLGTLSSLAVTGNATAGNVYANSGTIGASLLTGTLTTAAQPNVTSVGTLTSLSVTGNVAAGNLTTTGVLSVTGTGVSSIAGNLDMTSNTIINLATPTNANDAATKQYVDDVAQGLHTHDSCNAATQTDLATISGGTVTYNNGSSGVGATLTTTGSYTTIDGVTLSNGMRILVKNEANAAHNGIYDRTSSTVLTRSTDFDTPAEMAGGDFTFVTAGTLYDNTGWVMTDPVTTVGTTNVNWVQFSGAGTYTAGTGLTLTGSQFSITNTAVSAGSYGNSDAVATFTVNAQGQLTAASNTVIQANAANLSGTTLKSTVVTSSLTSVGTVTSGTWNSLVGSSATFAAGLSGANLASITGANVTGTVATATTAGTVTTAAQPNITSVGTLTSLSVTGNVACAAFFDASVNAAVSAAGTVQANATVIANEINVVSTVASGAGVALPSGLAGIRVTLINTAANACLVYPASGGTINSLASNAAFSLAAGARLDFVCTSATQWYTLNATYA